MSDEREKPIVITRDMLAPGTDSRVDFERGMRTAPPLILLLIAANVALFGWELAAGALASRESIVEAGALVRDRVLAGEWWRLESATFLHAGWDHLIGNCLVLYVVGMACEHAFGFARTAVVYFTSGLTGSLLSTTLSPGPSVGASGAIFGVVASFLRDLFLGKFRLDLIHPYPEQDPEEVRRAQPFLDKLERLLREQVDSDRIDREGEIPEAVIQGLRDLGAFGIKIPREYGGLGLSQLSYMRAIELVSSIDGSVTALLSAPQSIGVPQPLKLFGTDAQKKKYLARLAKGAISAVALTDLRGGRDPGLLATTAVPTSDGQAWVLNGEKLWCTNGTKAELLVVIARTPSKVVNGKEKRQITAFIVETAWPGVKVEHRCHFMGLKAIYNGVMRFTNVRVPNENVLWEVGKGLKLGLITLNTGRLTLPISSVAAGKRCLEISRQWASERVQWGRAIGKHDAIGQKIGAMAANTFAMEAVAELCGAMAEIGRAHV